MDDKVSIYKLVSTEENNTDFINVVQEENGGDYVLFNSGEEADPVLYYTPDPNKRIKFIINKPEGIIKGSNFTGQMFLNRKNNLNSTEPPSLKKHASKSVRENPDIYPPSIIKQLLGLGLDDEIVEGLKNHPKGMPPKGMHPKGGKRRTRRRRQRSNKKRTNKRKKTKTRMKKRKTHKRKTNKRRRKR